MDLVQQKLEEATEIAIYLLQEYRFVFIGAGAIIGLLWYFKKNHGFFRKQGIPGPNPGLFGAFSGYSKLGIAKYDQEIVKKYGKVCGIFHATQPIYLISDPDMIRQITVKNFASFVNRSGNTLPPEPAFKDSVLTLEDDHWKFIRSILSPTFTSGRMRDMAPLIQKCTDTLVKNLWKATDEGKKSVKMRDIFSMFTMDVIASTAFGVEIDCQNDPDNPFMKNAQKIMNPGPRLWIVFILCALFPFMQRVITALGIHIVTPSVADFFVKTIHGAIQHRKELGVRRNDFLELMLKSKELEEDREDQDSDTYLEFDKTKRRGMTDSEIVSNATVFLLAGFETTSMAVSFVAYNLATNPECQEKLIKEIDKVLDGTPPDYDNVSKLQYLENVFLETLRIFPPAVRTSRFASEDVEINGVLIKKGFEVHFPFTAIHNDPDIWHDPETFDPDRFLPENRPKDYNYVFLTFGAGPRNCIGMRLAHFEIKMAIAGILQKYRFIPAPDTKIPPELDKRQMKPVDGMVLMIEKR